ncbi:hypothetical protein ACFPMF_10650 [Larkinella bovis]|uniref:Lipocalin-like domain-containing protein n=1 Tax=Larkinella bovis TaxID=683041 RepID=A0ABW0I8I1_9BACT
MKTAVYILLMALIVVGCKKSNREPEPLPSDPLYRTWKLTETQNPTGDWKTVSYERTIKFLPAGTIQYLVPQVPCCWPVRFDRQGQRLKLTEIYLGAGCETVYCASPSVYTILSLTDSELILESFYGSTNPVSGGLMKFRN